MKHDNHTFKHDGDTVQVYPISPAEFLVASYSGEVDVKGRAAVMDKSDAAEIMLAVAESAGIIPTHSDSWTVGEPDNLARIAADLQHHIERRDARTKEAAERKALEARRDELVREFKGAHGRYALISPLAQNAINRVIELENGGTK